MVHKWNFTIFLWDLIATSNMAKCPVRMTSEARMWMSPISDCRFRKRRGSKFSKWKLHGSKKICHLKWVAAKQTQVNLHVFRGNLVDPLPISSFILTFKVSVGHCTVHGTALYAFKGRSRKSSMDTDQYQVNSKRKR